MEIIASRKRLEVTNKDWVLFDGYCYKIITRGYRYGKIRTICPVITNSRAEKLIKDGKLVLDSTDKGMLWHYRFNVE